MAQVYDYMKDIGPAAAEGLAEGYLRLRGAALALAERYGLGKLAGIAAGAPDLMYTLAMLLRDGRVPLPPSPRPCGTSTRASWPSIGPARSPSSSK